MSLLQDIFEKLKGLQKGAKKAGSTTLSNVAQTGKNFFTSPITAQGIGAQNPINYEKIPALVMPKVQPYVNKASNYIRDNIEAFNKSNILRSDEPLAGPIGRTLQKTPTIKTGNLPNLDIGSNLYNLGAETVKSWGKSMERVSTPEKRIAARKDAEKLIEQVGNKDAVGAISNPALEDIFNATDLIPGGLIFGGIKNIGKKGVLSGGKRILEAEALRAAERQAAKKALKDGATATGEKVATKAEVVGKKLADILNKAKSGDVVYSTGKAKNYTDINPKELKKIFTQKAKETAKAGEEKLKTSLDDLLNKLKVTDEGGTVYPFEKKIPDPNTYTKINPEKIAKEQFNNSYTKIDPEELNRAQLNVESGLPAGGVTPAATEKVSIASKLADRFGFTSRKALSDMGDVGKNIANRIDTMYNNAEIATGNAVADLQRIVGDLNDEGFEAVIKGLRGEADGLPQNSRVLKEVRKVLDTVFADAKKVGVDVGYRENYAPQMIDLDKLGQNRDAAIKHFVDTKQFSSFNDATAFVNDVLSGADIKEAYSRFGKAIPKKMGNLEFSRVLDWVPGVLRNDKKVLSDYIQQAYTRISQVDQFGLNNEKGTNLLNALQTQGKDVKLAQTILDQNLGLIREDRAIQKAGNLARSVQAAMKLPLAAISNAAQSVNTASRYGIKRTLKTIYQYATGGKSAQEEYALRTGATLDATMQQILDQYKGKSALDKIIAPGFGAVENFNRVISANVGRDYALNLVKKLTFNPSDAQAALELEKMIRGVDIQVVIKEGLSEMDLQKAGQAAVNLSQFKVRPIDLPVTWNSTLGKVMTQFKSFSYKQGEFVVNEILKPALKGNVAPLSRYLLLGIIVGEGTNDIKAKLTGRERPTDPLERAAENVSSVGGAGYVQSALEALQYGEKGIMEFVAGPTFSDAAKMAVNTFDAAKGNPKPLAKQLIGDIPFVGRPFINANKESFSNAAQPKTLDSIFAGISGTGAGTTGTPPASDSISAAEQFIAQNPGMTPLEQQAIDDQITALQKEEKRIVGDNGTTIPFINKKIGGTSDDEKNAALLKTQEAIKILQERKSYADKDEAGKQVVDFKKSDKNFLDLGDVVLRKSPSGEVSTLTKDAYNSSLNTAKLTNLKKNDDLEGWKKVADEQFAVLARRMEDPLTDELDKVDIQNKIDTLISDYQKFTGYGGFTKGKTGSSANATKLKNAFKQKQRKSIRSSVPTLPSASKPSTSISAILKGKRKAQKLSTTLKLKKVNTKPSKV